MVMIPNSITTLKAYYGDRLHVPNQANLHTELMEGNDRSAIITIAAICDSGLEQRIALELPGLKKGSKKDVDDAFRHDGALGSFSARINLAFYMNLIDATTRSQLNDVRHIRNAVAHTRRRVTLGDVQLQNAVLRILHPTGMYKLLDETPDGFLRSFLAEGMLLWTIIQWGRDKAVSDVRAAFIADGKTAPF